MKFFDWRYPLTLMHYMYTHTYYRYVYKNNKLDTCKCQKNDRELFKNIYIYILTYSTNGSSNIKIYNTQ